MTPPARIPIQGVSAAVAGGCRHLRGVARLPGNAHSAEILIFERDGQLAAIPAACPHEGWPLPGLLEGDVVRCPAHGMEVAVFGPRATAYPVEREGDAYWLRSSADRMDVTCSRPCEGARAGDDAQTMVLRLGRELEALRAANAVQEQQISANSAMVDEMLRELEEQRNALRLANQQQHATHAFITRVMDSMDSLLMVVDTRGRISQVNRMFARQAGISPEEAVGRALDDLLPQGERQALALALPELPWEVKSVLLENLRRDTRYRAEHRLCLTGGATNCSAASCSADIYLLLGTLLHDTQGKLEGAVFTATNVTASKLQEAALKDSEERFRLTTQFAKDAIVLIDENDHIYSWNLTAEGMFGYSEREVLGRAFHDIVVPERYRAHFRVAFERFRATGEATGAIGRTRELFAHRRDGSEFPLEVSVSAVRIGEHFHSIGLMRDITERKAAEEELSNYRAGLEALVEARTQELVTAKDAAEAANHAKSEFLANMSHELRTPMHAILSFSALGKTRLESARPDQLLRYFDSIHTSGQRLLNLLNDLLDISKLEAGQMVLDIAEQELAPVLADVMGELEALASAKHIRLVRESPDVTVIAPIDRVRIGQVVRNLLSNAIKFSPDGSRVTVACGLEAGDGENHAWLRVDDEGVGIPPEELDLVFTKFVQSSRTRTKAGGTGLGLAICKQIVDAHRGSIRAANRPEGGARFEVRIPSVGRAVGAQPVASADQTSVTA